jgi:uracil-DNA glycosylase
MAPVHAPTRPAPVIEPRTVTLQSETDLAGFREAARGLLAAQVEPEYVTWITATRADELFADEGPPAAPAGASAVVPAWFVTLCNSVILHRDPQRFGLLYRLLWRLVHEPGLRHDPLDADRVRAAHMAQAVRRDLHKMKAFVRFRPVDDGGAGPLHVAWFEPAHYIVEANAPFFARRFTNMRWAILTPDRSVQWDGERLVFGPGAQRADAPGADAGEALWLTYYQSIFNPARLKLKMMQKEMPRKYWENLPEAKLIQPLAAAAHQRGMQMVESEPTRMERRMPAASSSLRAPAAPPRTEPIRSMAQLREATNVCRECPIGEYATQSVCGEGPMGAQVMFVGEQPGDKEDLAGKPFVGPAGALLGQALEQLGIDRAQVFVSNAVKHFKYELRGKRRIHKSPTQREAAACQHWLEDEIAMVKPGMLVALGATAARSLMGRTVAVTKERGQILERPDGYKVLITLHPSALLRMPMEEKEEAFAEFVKDLSVLLE